MSETIFGQLVVGPPGSGKSTYCKYISENLRQLGRNSKIINLDPANDSVPYKAAINIVDFIKVDSVMEKTGLGPNGALIRCMELLDEHFAWLFDQIVLLMKDEKKSLEEAHKDSGEEISHQDRMRFRPYLIFDCPGQSELYTHHKSTRGIISKITAKNSHFDLRLVCMNLCDSFHASDLNKYVGLVMNSLSTMLHLELPHVNVLSKVDIIEKHGKTRFNLDFYCEAANLDYLLETELESPFHTKYRKLTKAIIGVIDDYSLVTFTSLNIQEPEDIYRVLQLADKANGYYCDDLDLSVLQLNPRLMEMASGRRIEPLDDATA